MGLHFFVVFLPLTGFSERGDRKQWEGRGEQDKKGPQADTRIRMLELLYGCIISNMLQFSFCYE